VLEGAIHVDHPALRVGDQDADAAAFQDALVELAQRLDLLDLLVHRAVQARPLEGDRRVTAERDQKL